MVNWQNAGRIAGQAVNTGGNILGSGFDYVSSKAEGEDDIRAAAGALGSGLGGWGAALKGAALGSAFGPAGAFAGGLIAGMAGDFAGGWAADRLDEFVRGKNTGVKNKTMTQAVQLENGDVAQVDDDGNFIGWLIKGGVLLGGSEVLYNVGKELMTDYGFNRISQPLPYSNSYASMQAAKQTFQNAPNLIRQGAANSTTRQVIGNVWNKIPGSNVAKGIGTAVIIGDQLTGGNLAKGVGRVLGGGADMIANAAGFKTDFDGQNKMSQQQIKQNNEAARVDNALKVANIFDDELIRQGFRNRQELEDYNNRLWNREKEEANRIFQEKDRIARRNYLTEFTATQARDLLKNYAEMPASVARGIAEIYQATGR